MLGELHALPQVLVVLNHPDVGPVRDWQRRHMLPELDRFLGQHSEVVHCAGTERASACAGRMARCRRWRRAGASC